jgi:hypothetical protein
MPRCTKTGVLAPTTILLSSIATIIIGILICLLAMRVESTFVVAPSLGTRNNLANLPTVNSHSRTHPRRRHDDDNGSRTSDNIYFNDNDNVATYMDESRRKLLMAAPSSALSVFLVWNSDARSASASTSTAPTTPSDIITFSPNDDSVGKQVNTASMISSQTQTSSSSSSSSSSSRGILCADTEESSRIAIFERVAPSVVYIDTFSEKRDVFSTNVLEVPVGSGSGFIWDTNGHIVTNFHVVQEAKSAQVAILTSGRGGAVAGGGGRSIIKPAYTSVRPGALGIDGSTVLPNYTRIVYKAKVIGVDPTKDIAVLKVDDAPMRELRPIEVGTSTGLRVGQGSLAIGNPFGLDHTLT